MTPDLWLSLGRQALWLMLVASAPPVGASLLVGFVMGLFQATTQIQESTLSSVPKVLASIGALMLSGPWMAVELQRFTTQLLMALPEVMA